MSQSAIESFLGRLITDARFKAKVASSLENACRDEGLIFSEEEISYLKKINFFLFDRVAESLDDAIKRG
jgi:hypothetical protein